MSLEGASYTCNVCDVSFNRKCKFHYHSEAHDDHSEKNSKDSSSNKICQDLKPVTLSKPRRVNASSSCKNTIICVICRKKFQRVDLLGHHIALSHPNTRRLKCNECLKIFVAPDRYLAHKQMHLNEEKSKSRKENIETSRSSQTYRTQLSLKQTSPLPFLCGLCQQRFTSYTNLWNHAWIHSDEKPYNCKICGTGFGRLYRLRYHMNSHSNVRPYTCQDCGKKFKLLAVFKSHQCKHKKLVSPQSLMSAKKKTCQKKEENILQKNKNIPKSCGKGTKKQQENVINPLSLKISKVKTVPIQKKMGKIVKSRNSVRRASRSYITKQMIINKIFLPTAVLVHSDEKKVTKLTSELRHESSKASHNLGGRGQKLVQESLSREAASSHKNVEVTSKSDDHSDDDQKETTHETLKANSSGFLQPGNEIPNVLPSTMKSSVRNSFEEHIGSLQGKKSHFKDADDKRKLMFPSEIRAQKDVQSSTKASSNVSKVGNTSTSGKRKLISQTGLSSQQPNETKEWNVFGVKSLKQENTIPTTRTLKWKIYRCITCFKFYKHSTSLFRHYRQTNHKAKTEGKNNWKMKICNNTQAFKDERLAVSLKKHTPLETNTKDSRTRIHKAKYPQEANNLQPISEVVTGNEPLFSLPKRMRSRRTIKKKVYSCNICGKQYWYLQALKNHIKDKKCHDVSVGTSSEKKSFNTSKKENIVSFSSRKGHCVGTSSIKKIVSTSKQKILPITNRKGHSIMSMDNGGGKIVSSQKVSSSVKVESVQENAIECLPFSCKICHTQYKYMQSLRRHVKKTSHFFPLKDQETRLLIGRKSLVSETLKDKRNSVHKFEEKKLVKAPHCKNSVHCDLNENDKLPAHIKKRFPHMTNVKLLEIDSSTDAIKKTSSSRSSAKKREFSFSIPVAQAGLKKASTSMSGLIPKDSSSTKPPISSSKEMHSILRIHNRNHNQRSKKVAFVQGPKDKSTDAEDFIPKESNTTRNSTSISKAKASCFRSSTVGLTEVPEKNSNELYYRKGIRSTKEPSKDRMQYASSRSLKNPVKSTSLENKIFKAQKNDYENDFDCILDSYGVLRKVSIKDYKLGLANACFAKVTPLERKHEIDDVNDAQSDSECFPPNIIITADDILNSDGNSLVKHLDSPKKQDHINHTTLGQFSNDFTTNQVSKPAADISGDIALSSINDFQYPDVEMVTEISENVGEEWPTSESSKICVAKVHTCLESHQRNIDRPFNCSCVESIPTKSVQIVNDIKEGNDPETLNKNAFSKTHSNVLQDSAFKINFIGGHVQQNSCKYPTATNCSNLRQDNLPCPRFDLTSGHSSDTRLSSESDFINKQLPSEKEICIIEDIHNDKSIDIVTSCQDTESLKVDSPLSDRNLEDNMVESTKFPDSKARNAISIFPVQNGSAQYNKPCSNPKLYQCKDCLFSFKHPQSLKRHCTRQVCKKKSNTLKFEYLCGKTCSSALNLAKQKHKETCKGTFKCGICQKHFQSEFLLEDHIAKNDHSKEFTCQDCKTIFLKDSDLEYHKILKNCMLCNYKFSCSSLFELHRQSHLKSYYSEDASSDNKQAHTKNKNYHDQYCVNSKNQSHIKASFPRGEDEQTKDGTLKIVASSSKVPVNSYFHETNGESSLSSSGILFSNDLPQFRESALVSDVQENTFCQGNNSLAATRIYTKPSNVILNDPGKSSLHSHVQGARNMQTSSHSLCFDDTHSSVSPCDNLDSIPTLSVSDTALQEKGTSNISQMVSEAEEELTSPGVVSSEFVSSNQGSVNLTTEDLVMQNHEKNRLCTQNTVDCSTTEAINIQPSWVNWNNTQVPGQVVPLNVTELSSTQQSLYYYYPLIDGYCNEPYKILYRCPLCPCCFSTLVDFKEHEKIHRM